MKINKIQLADIIKEAVQKKLRELSGEVLSEKLASVDDDIDTYAKAMDSTEMYPWTQMISGEYEDPRSKGLEQQSVNTLARERFTQEFYNKYPLESTTIQTTIGPMVFKNLSFKSNHTNYDVTFGNDNVYPSRIHIVYDPQDGYYITSNQNKINLVDQESIRLVQDMLKYNQARKQNYKSDSAIRGSIQESLRRAFGLSEVEKVASDGGYYGAPEDLVYVTRSDAEAIKKEAAELYEELFDMSMYDGNALVKNKHGVKKKIIGDMQNYYNINLDYDVGDGGREHVYWIAEGQDLEAAKEAFNSVVETLYDKVLPDSKESDSSTGESMDDLGQSGYDI